MRYVSHLFIFFPFWGYVHTPRGIDTRESVEIEHVRIDILARQDNRRPRCDAG